MSRYAIDRGGELVHQIVFEASNNNYPAPNVVLVSYESLNSAQELARIWPDARIFDLKNNLHVVPESGIM